MKWKIAKANSRKNNLDKNEHWELACSRLGLTESSSGPFIAKHFKDFMNGKELKKGFTRKLVGVKGTVHYLTLEEYNPEMLTFTVSVSSEYLDNDTKYLIIRNKINEEEEGSTWEIEVSKKKTIWSLIVGRLNSNINNMFHNYTDFGS